MVGEVVLLVPLEVVVVENDIDLVLNLLRGHLLQVFNTLAKTIDLPEGSKGDSLHGGSSLVSLDIGKASFPALDEGY
jgi:hypothetical protein